jgi:phage baseplate assembly protein W
MATLSPPIAFEDFPLDFTIHPIRKDLVLLTNADAVVRSIRNLLQTNHYEIPFHPEIGCNIRKLLFENVSDFTARDISRFVQETIENFEPRCSIQSLIVTPDEEHNLYNVTLRVFINASANVLTVNLILERVR